MPFLSPKSLASLLESAVSAHSSLLGRAAHAQVVKTLGLALDAFLSNHLINMYSKLDRPETARTILSLTSPHFRSVVTWTSLISGNVQNGHVASALSCFSTMHQECIQPNDFTFPCLFKAATSLHSPILGQQFHGLAIKLFFIDDVFVACSAFDMYSKTGFCVRRAKCLMKCRIEILLRGMRAFPMQSLMRILGRRFASSSNCYVIVRLLRTRLPFVLS
ncbi:UNVERIFIED_CONTAM: Pentatricopeptide repeat-containing protein [Sesamum radiatum]|uniref:Pentatricopeptide repeat-containing protein n=1 Tax=Sesamum radiatum TaxID=300843 RepID=A0AAW2USD7_SESRA